MRAALQALETERARLTAAAEAEKARLQKQVRLPLRSSAMLPRPSVIVLGWQLSYFCLQLVARSMAAGCRVLLPSAMAICVAYPAVQMFMCQLSE